MTTLDDIYSFLEKSQGLRRKDLSPDSDLCLDLGVDGDDFFELEEEFAKLFRVDMSKYLWYFHHGEEGWNFGSLLFAAPYQRVKHIPVTPALLLDAAKSNRWPIEYPPHSLPSRRYDIYITIALPFVFLGLLALVVFL